MRVAAKDPSHCFSARTVPVMEGVDGQCRLSASTNESRSKYGPDRMRGKNSFATECSTSLLQPLPLAQGIIITQAYDTGWARVISSPVTVAVGLGRHRSRYTIWRLVGFNLVSKAMRTSMLPLSDRKSVV